VVWFGIADTPPRDQGSVDLAGLFWAVVTIGLVMCGLILVRVDGPGSLWPWLVILLGFAAVVPFARVELASPDPLVDVRLIVRRTQWPVQVTAFLLGMSVLGAQIPLSTFVRTDPDKAGYGLGASAGFVSVLIVIYVLCMVVGALAMPSVARRLGMRAAMIVAALLITLGYALFVPFHAEVVELAVNMLFAGLGSGALVASVPAAAAAAAPPDRTGFVTGMTNTTKTIGGAIASSIFAIALSSAGSIADAKAGHASLSGYITVWIVCAATALLAAVLLRLAPRDAFGEL
jgi:MFS family permease